MALSFKEKRTLTKVVNAKVEELNTGGLSFKGKRKATKSLNDAVKKLSKKEIDVKGSKTLEKILSGAFDSLPPIKFLAMLEKATNELGGDIEPIKEATVKYIEKNIDSEDLITESAPQSVYSNPGDAVRIIPMVDVDGNHYNEIRIDIDEVFNEPRTFRRSIQSLEDAKDPDIAFVKINSPGGRTDSAQAMYVALLETKARTQAKIINAASSGSIVAMACDEILTTPFCQMMIHSASSGVQGKVNDMAAYATYNNDYFKEWYQHLYSGFMTEDEIMDVVKGQEFWLKEKQIRERLSNWKPIRQRQSFLIENGLHPLSGVMDGKVGISQEELLRKSKNYE